VRQRQGRHLRPGHGFQADVAGLGQQHGTDAERQIGGGRLAIGHVGEGAGKAGKGVHFPQQGRQLDLGQALSQLGPQRAQVVRLALGGQRAQRDVGLPVLLEYLQGRVVRQIRANLRVGRGQLLLPTGQFDLRVGGALQGPSHGIADLLPGLAA